MGAIKLSEVNKKLQENPVEFVKSCDDMFNKDIAFAASVIRKRRSQSPIVLLSGPSGSGKTTTALKLEHALEKLGIVTHTVSIDDYFKTIDPKTAPRTADGDVDYESPECVDMELLNEHFDILTKGGEIQIPHFMFARQKRATSITRPLRLGPHEIVIFEGIHALNDEISGKHPEAFKVYISTDSTFVKDDGKVAFEKMWLRMIRRIVRDDNFRGSSAIFTLELWDNVLDGERKYIYPFKDRADIILDSALPYEVAAIKKQALSLLNKLPDNVPFHSEIEYIIEAFGLSADLADECIPKDSLIREFIGGSIYYNN